MTKTVLIVEDDKFLGDLLVKKLKKEKFNAILALNGIEAMEMLQKNKVDIVLLDILMPGIDGFEVLTKMKKNPQIRDIPVIILSNLGSKEDIEKSMRLGADDHLVKAIFTLDEIVEKIQLLLAKKFPL